MTSLLSQSIVHFPKHFLKLVQVFSLADKVTTEEKIKERRLVPHGKKRSKG